MRVYTHSLRLFWEPALIVGADFIRENQLDGAVNRG